MEKELPKVFHQDIDKELNNNDKIFHSKLNEERSEENTNNNFDIRKKISDIFASPNYIYKANVIITTNDDTIETRIIGRNKNFLITMDNKTIAIDEIKDIKIKK